MGNAILLPNDYLQGAFYTLEYYSVQRYGDDPDLQSFIKEEQFILTLKNTYRRESSAQLLEARNTAAGYIRAAVREIAQMYGMADYAVVAVPRSKAYDTYFPEQLYFIEAVGDAARSVAGAVDGSRFIQRTVNTKTTHLGREVGRSTPQRNIYKGEGVNDGPEPYDGITLDTCAFNEAGIRGRDIILVDDIYTHECNIDEDCIQALYRLGARRVVLYTVAQNMRKQV